jgi:hypothetical protein
MSDLKLVDMRSYRALEEGTPEYEEWKRFLAPSAEARKKALVDFYTARMERRLEQDRLAKARLAWSQELSLVAEREHIERRTTRLIQREREGLALVEVRALGDWHAKQARLHTEAAGWCRSKASVLRPMLARRKI